MSRLKKILNYIFNTNAADSAADRYVQQHAARYGLDVGGAGNSAGTGWNGDLEQKDIQQAVADMNDGLAKSGAKFRVKDIPAPRR